MIQSKLYETFLLFCFNVQMLHDLNTYLHKAIPDTKLTIRKYLDVKFEYLVRPHSEILCFYTPDEMLMSDVDLLNTTSCVFQSYCLKVKEMDDEEYSSIVSTLKSFILFLHNNQDWHLSLKFKVSKEFIKQRITFEILSFPDSWSQPNEPLI